MEVTSAYTGVASANDQLQLMLKGERARVELIEHVSPSVVSIFDSKQQGGGSGVIIDPKGYGLTNFHVVAGMMDTRRGLGGFSDGGPSDETLYPLEVLGIDPTGDVAMFQLTGRDEFPYLELGDSEAVRVGDQVLAMGNPFVISEDYTPTVTMGIVTGVHRYQWGTGNNLIYSDCIQTDAPINPGNSGGPLIDLSGRVIGINGRISVNTRGRLNVGFAYAISANQIRRFIPSLRAGLLARHGTLQAVVKETADERVVFTQVRPLAAGELAGLRVGDQLLQIDGISVPSLNRFASVIQTYPGDFPILVTVERDGEVLDLQAKLAPLSPGLHHPFEVDHQVNLRQTENILSRFQKAVLSGDRSRMPQRWQWSVQRTYWTDSPPGHQKNEHFTISQTGDGSAIWEEKLEDGGHPSRCIVFDSKTANLQVGNHRGRTNEEERGAHQERHEPVEGIGLSVDERMVLNAIYVLQRVLPSPLETLDLSDVRHSGSGRIIRIPSDATDPRLGKPRGIDFALLEVLDWPLGSDTIARIGFDADSYHIARITVVDLVTQREVVLDFHDHNDIGGLTWPTHLTVHIDDIRYEDRWSNWELSP